MTYKTTEEIINGDYCPLPIDIIPNQMGINLCSVKAVEWEKQDDGQLVWLKVHFIPNNQHQEETEEEVHGTEEQPSKVEIEYLKLRRDLREALFPVWPNGPGATDAEIVEAVGDVVSRTK